MKSSFYFVLWIGVYFILDLINIPSLQNNAFVVAFIVVIIVQSLTNRALAPDIIKSRQIATLRLFEDVYENNLKAFLSRQLYNLILYGFFAVYFVFTFIWILRFANFSDIGESLFEIVIFGALAFYYVYRTGKIGNRYFQLRQLKGRVLGPEGADTLLECFPELAGNPEYARFREERAIRSFKEIIDSQPRVSGFYRISNIVFSVGAIALGVWFLRVSIPHILGFGQAGMYMIILLLYGTLALQAGVKDLIELNR